MSQTLFRESEAPRGKPRGIFAEPCETQNAIPPCGKPHDFLAKKGEGTRIYSCAHTLHDIWWNWTGRRRVARDGIEPRTRGFSDSLDDFYTIKKLL